MTGTSMLRLNAILLLTLSCMACTYAPANRFSKMDSDFYYTPPQTTASVLTSGADIN